jgi:hypothetical protein
LAAVRIPGEGQCMTHHRPRAAAILVVPVVVAIVLTLFVWPSARLEPRELPVGVAGGPAAVTAIEKRLGARDGAFAVHRFADEAAARHAIEERDVYGAFVVTPTGPRLLIASAASAAVAQTLSHAAAGAQATPVPVQDVVAASPAAAALASLLLPLIIAGGLTGIAATRLASGALRRAGLMVTGSVLVGLTATAIVQSWLGVVEGEWVANAGALSLIVLAMTSLVAGLEALFGRAGTIVAVLTLVLIGNPLSGAASSPELLPQPAGAFGQLLPPGAGASLLRSTGFFDGAAAGGHVAVLAAWALAGLAAVALAAARGRDRLPATAPLPA